MLGRLLGSVSKERVLVFVVARGRGYPREVATFFQTPVRGIQVAFDGLEAAGVIVGRDLGKTREYTLNPRYLAIKEVENLVRRALEYYPEDLRTALFDTRQRPRRRGKP